MNANRLAQIEEQLSELRSSLNSAWSIAGVLMALMLANIVIMALAILEVW
jgi:hypothetical protein